MTPVEYKLKEETLLALFIENSLKSGNTIEAVKEQWKIVKQTLTQDNIDDMVAVENLKALVRQNRAKLGYNPTEIATVLTRTLSEALPTPQVVDESADDG